MPDDALFTLRADTPDQIAAHMYKQVGLEAALGYLYRIMRERLPVTRMQCGIFDFEEGLVWQLATLGTFPGRVPGHVVRIADIVSDFEEPFSLEALSRLSVAKRKKGEPVRLPAYMADYARHAAFVRFPLFVRDNVVCALTLYCDEPGVPRAANVRDLAALAAPLGEAMSGSILGGRLHAGDQGGSAVKLLRQCPDMASALQRMERVALTDATVLLTGETGVGKGFAAEAIHELSGKRAGPFVAVNCGGLPESLIDSLLFGHERGAFTGAIHASKGYFEQAQGGTLFLDEVAELPLPVQARLLRVLDKFVIQRIGSPRQTALDVRIIAATNRDLEDMVERGAFREDLYFRLHAYRIDIPPLRGRPRDLPVLLRHFMYEKCQRMKLARVPGVSRTELDALAAYAWPGNVRQLEHVVESALIGHLAAKRPQLLLREQLENQPRLFRKKADVSPEKPPEERGDGGKIAPDAAAFPSLEDVAAGHIRKALEASGGRLSGPHGAAELLGVHRTTLARYLQKMGAREKN